MTGFRNIFRNISAKAAGKAAIAVTGAAAACCMTGCDVHEFPYDRATVDVVVTVHHDLPWTSIDYTYEEGRANLSRDGSSETGRGQLWTARYIFRAYPRGERGTSYREFTMSSDDLTLADFDITLPLPAGDWDICVWQDLVSDAEQPPYYNVDDFAAITYNMPYRGDTDRRDAFEGTTSVSVRATYDSDAEERARIDMERPMARYVFIATDYDLFTTGMSKGEDDSDFSIYASYPLFMPAVYNMFTSKILDSWRGVSYRAHITPLNEKEAVIAIDYVFMNHHESGAQVLLGLTDPRGATTAITPTVTVPLQRGQTTYVRGKFLTNTVGNGIDIDFSFSGDINIEL
ncbi:MAG: hypothetical protein HDS54_07895 [Barnesiella sp.]|nr:hypothetical protein [Bacteroidales bacterium]MBD5248066.1 hypothetical protein [Barnesiella sp.]